MMHDILSRLGQWEMLDTWIVLTAALSGMACALPGCYLLLRRQSMLGDALSHTALLGVAVAFLVSNMLGRSGWIPVSQLEGARHALMFAGAMLIGLLAAVLVEAIREWGRVESSAALGVVFTTLFALGLLIIRVAADDAHIDPDCVLYGLLELVEYEARGPGGIPRAVLVNGGVLLVNGLLVLLFYKELLIASFDPALATSLGIPARRIRFLLTAITSATLTAAFESVGSILSIALLIVPAAASFLLTERLGRMLLISLAIAALAALTGHAAALSVVPVVMQKWGFAQVDSGSSAGMIAVAGGVLFLLALLLSPRNGVIALMLGRLELSSRIAGEDILGEIYRLEESSEQGRAAIPLARLAQCSSAGCWLTFLGGMRLWMKGEIAREAGGFALTERGRARGAEMIRSHRLWESYISKRLGTAEDHLHGPASRVEHYLDPVIREKLDRELAGEQTDPHGKTIPPEQNPPGERGV